MASSGNYTFNLSRDQIIRGALRKVQAIAAGEVPNAQTTQDATEALNAMTKEWHARGIHVWTETEAILFLQPNQILYTLGAGSTDHAATIWNTTTLTVSGGAGNTTLAVVSVAGVAIGMTLGVPLDAGPMFWTTVTAVDTTALTISIAAALPSTASAPSSFIFTYTPNLTGAGNNIIRPLRVPFARRLNMPTLLETPMMQMSRSDYEDLPDKTSTGTITQFYYSPQIPLGQMFLWPATPYNVDHLRFTFLRPIQDWTDSTNTGDFPVEWMSTLIFNLAVEIAPEYGCPPEIYQMVKGAATEKLELITSGWDKEPEDTTFQVDFTRMGYSSL